MNLLKNIISMLMILVFFNIIFIFNLTSFNIFSKIIITVISTFFYFLTLYKAPRILQDSKRLKQLNHGCNLIMFSGYTLIAEIIITAIICIKTEPAFLTVLMNSLFSAVFLFVMIFAGIFKTVIKSKQIKFIWYIFLFFGWYIPILNIVIFRYFYKTGRREFYFEMSRLELENARAKNSVCNTKYPILMVHGIFFRDWQFFNYWGRIPEALITNGAKIYYGNQQSAKSIKDSAEELKDRILEVIAETGAEKVNIIAHSKGGLDSRYAISKLGMDKYVASLITINTPHNGCDFVENLLKAFPKGIINFISGKYNNIFSKLGDNSPDFLAGVEDLKSSSCKAFNDNVPDSPYVYYESYMSEMQSFFSAGIPLNIGYLLIKKCNGKSDGLVWIESARYGEHFTLIKNKYRRGISHGDMIDLFRENIKGFDVREFYVNIAEKLKQKGF